MESEMPYFLVWSLSSSTGASWEAIIPGRRGRATDYEDRAVDGVAVVPVSDPGRDPVRSPLISMRERILVFVVARKL